MNGEAQTGRSGRTGGSGGGSGGTGGDTATATDTEQTRSGVADAVQDQQKTGRNSRTNSGNSSTATATRTTGRKRTPTGRPRGRPRKTTKLLEPSGPLLVDAVDAVVDGFEPIASAAHRSPTRAEIRDDAASVLAERIGLPFSAVSVTLLAAGYPAASEVWPLSDDDAGTLSTAMLKAIGTAGPRVKALLEGSASALNYLNLGIVMAGILVPRINSTIDSIRAESAIRAMGFRTADVPNSHQENYASTPDTANTPDAAYNGPGSPGDASAADATVANAADDSVDLTGATAAGSTVDAIRPTHVHGA